MKEEKNTLSANGVEIAIITRPDETDYISLTDIARHANPSEPKDVVKNWMRSRSTIEFLGLWEKLHNPDFKGVEFDSFRSQAGLNSFTLSPQLWIRKTNAIGIMSKVGKNGGTFAHSDIAFEFASWVSPEFKLYIIQDYQRLKKDEAHQLRLEWQAKRLISKANYHLHTDAVQKHILRDGLTKQQISYTYADEADLINVALFGMTAKEWRDMNPGAKGNIRDNAGIAELVVLSNLEALNAEFIRQSFPQSERLIALRRIAVYQMNVMADNSSAKKLDDLLLPKKRG